MAPNNEKGTPKVQDVVPYRGQYDPSTAGRLLFTATRSAIPILYYSVLAPASSPYSITKYLPFLNPRPPQGVGASVPGIPSYILKSTSQTLGLAPYSTLVFVASVLSSIQFIGYALIFRQETFPMSGEASAPTLSMVIQGFDVFQLIFFAFLAQYNPTWSETGFRYSWILFFIGFTFHFGSDLTKWIFKSNPKNKGKVLTSGFWGIVRHPNYIGITTWRPAMALATGGLVWCGLITAMFTFISNNLGKPALEKYMEGKYGTEWEEAKRKVPYAFIPGIY